MTRSCPDCGVKPGELHQSGCDVERCPRCGGQWIGCDCIYIVNGLDPAAIDLTHTDVYTNGPTDAMYEKWEAEWGDRHMRWTGDWPGRAECRELGWYAKLVPGQGWVRCSPDEPGATEDLDRLCSEAVWNPDLQRYERRGAARLRVPKEDKNQQQLYVREIPS